MENSAKTPFEAYNLVKKSIEIDFKYNSHLGKYQDGFFYVVDRKHLHANRRYAGCFIKGKDQDILKNQCIINEDGIYILNN